MNNAKEFNVKKVNDPLIEKIEQAVNMAKQDEDWRHEYMISQSQNRSIELRGIEIGKKYGIRIGRQLGEKRGEERGEKRERERLARTMILKNLSIEDISEMTHLTLAEVRELCKEVRPRD